MERAIRPHPYRAPPLWKWLRNGPELYDEGARTYLLAGGDGGHVTPLTHSSYRPSTPVTVNLHGGGSPSQGSCAA